MSLEQEEESKYHPDDEDVAIKHIAKWKAKNGCDNNNIFDRSGDQGSAIPASQE